MADENEVELRQKFHPVDGGSVAAAELDDPARQMPSPRGLGDGVLAEVDAQIETDVRRTQCGGEGSGLIGTAAGGIEDCDSSDPLESNGRECRAQQGLQPQDIGGGSGMGKRQALDHGFGFFFTPRELSMIARIAGWVKRRSAVIA